MRRSYDGDCVSSRRLRAVQRAAASSDHSRSECLPTWSTEQLPCAVLQEAQAMAGNVRLPMHLVLPTNLAGSRPVNRPTWRPRDDRDYMRCRGRKKDLIKVGLP